MALPSTSASIPLSSRPTGGEVVLRGIWLRVLQALWLLLVLNDLYTLVVSYPAFYQKLSTVCASSTANCMSDQLTPQLVAALQQANLSLRDYAFYVLGWDILTTLTFLSVGMLIIWHKRNTWMGLFVSFFLINLGSLGTSYAHSDAITGNILPILDIFGTFLTVIYYPCLAFFFFLFPDGRLVPRWSWTLISLWIINAFFWVVPVESLNIVNWPPLFQSLELGIVFGGSAATQVYRFFYAATAVQRQQIKWIISGFALLILATVFSGLVFQIFPALAQRDSLLQAAINPLYRWYYLPVPICIGIALLRYRLWDIDVLINRTLVYGSLTAVLLGIYLGIVFAGQYLLASLIRPDNGVVLVISTLVVAALFQPLRQRVQRLVDQRFYRRKYDAARILDAFGITLRQEVDLNVLSQQVISVVQETMQPSHISLWINPVGAQKIDNEQREV